MKLKGKVAIITGSSGGIGHGIARLFAKEGSIVIVNSRVLERAEKVVREIIKEGGQAFPVQADVTDRKAVERMVREVLRHFEKIDVLVNNAGITFLRPSETLNEEE